MNSRVASSEQKHPFYKPLRRRVAIVAVIAAWLALGMHPAGDWLEDKIGRSACGESERLGCQCGV